MTRLLLDTHIWLWYVIGSRQLPESFRAAIDSSLGACWLSPISIWEAALLAERGRIQIKGNFSDVLSEVLRDFPVHQAPISFEIARRSREIDLPQQDPADRFIAATAVVHELTLVTVDQQLSAAPWLRVLSTDR